jgi:hypothetical protein
MTYLNTCLLLFCLNCFVEFKRLLLQPYLVRFKYCSLWFGFGFFEGVLRDASIYSTMLFIEKHNDLHFRLLCFKHLILEFWFGLKKWIISQKGLKNEPP